VEIYTLRNSNGCEARITNYGGIVLSLTMPDGQGRLEDVVLGFDRAEDYQTPVYMETMPYFGALIGRFGNRIAGGRFTLKGKEYQLPINNAPNSLHGGNGFDKRVWDGREISLPEGPALELRYLSQDGEEGYPGNLSVTAVYTLTDNNELKLEFTASTDQPTVINLTHHTYFNLKGAGNGDVLDHELTLHASRFVPIDATSIPLPGEPRPVEGTPFDFTRPAKIGARIDENDEQLKNGSGYDHNFVVDGYAPEAGLHLAASVYEPSSRRVMEVWTDEPGFQFYSGNFLDGSLTGKGGVVYQKRSGFCIEPQHYPDSPNRPNYPSTALQPGETYRRTMIYRFLVKR
jgi:aldose 1-epimerase